MKLYYTKGSCSFVPHVALREVGADFDLISVDLREKKLADGSDFLAVNPKGYVPMLERDDGKRIAECAAILQYVADQNPASGLAPEAGTDERYELQEWLSFVGGELHKGLPPLFMPYIPEEMRPVARARLTVRMDFLNQALAGKEWLMNDGFTVADAYCGGILNWTERAEYGLSEHPNVEAYYDRFCARDSVKAARDAEG